MTKFKINTDFLLEARKIKACVELCCTHQRGKRTLCDYPGDQSAALKT